MAEPEQITASDPATPDGAGKIHDLGRVVETGVERVRRLQQETRQLAHEQVELLARDMTALALRSSEIAESPISVRMPYPSSSASTRSVTSSGSQRWNSPLSTPAAISPANQVCSRA